MYWCEQVGQEPLPPGGRRIFVFHETSLKKNDGWAMVGEYIEVLVVIVI